MDLVLDWEEEEGLVLVVAMRPEVTVLESKVSEEVVDLALDWEEVEGLVLVVVMKLEVKVRESVD